MFNRGIKMTEKREVIFDEELLFELNRMNKELILGLNTVDDTNKKEDL